MSVSWGTTYYVDYVGGANTNAGTSTALAWKTCPGDSAASGVAAATMLKAGDSLVFKGGVVYTGTVKIRTSGTAGASIVYDGNSSGTFGTGKAIIGGQNLRYHGFEGAIVSYVIVQNFEIKDMKYNATASWASGAGLSIDDASYVTISGCSIHEMGYWNNDGSIWPAGSGVCMLRPTNCLITGCEITKTGLAGISLNGAVNCIISKNNIHDYLTWGVDLGGSFRVATGNNVCDNTIHDLWQYDAGYYGAAGDPPHTDYVFIRMGDGFHPVKNTVERNLFYNNCTFTNFGGTAMVFLSYADSSTIRNNIFINPHEYCAAYFGWTSAGTKFYNNTIYAPRTGGLRLETNGNNDIRNNIIVGASELIDYAGAVDLQNLICDYNCYYSANTARYVVQITPYTAHTFAAWQAMGYCPHGKVAAAISDMQFANVTGYPTACQTMDLHLTANSLAINAGATLTTGCLNDKDFVARPQQGIWDIGAYEYKASTVVSQPMVQRSIQEHDQPVSISKNELAKQIIKNGSSLVDLSGKATGLQEVRNHGMYFLFNGKTQETRKIIVVR